MSTEKIVGQKVRWPRRIFSDFPPLSSDSEGARRKIDTQLYILILITLKIADFWQNFIIFSKF